MYGTPRNWRDIVRNEEDNTMSDDRRSLSVWWYVLFFFALALATRSKLFGCDKIADYMESKSDPAQ